MVNKNLVSHLTKKITDLLLTFLSYSSIEVFALCSHLTTNYKVANLRFFLAGHRTAEFTRRLDAARLGWAAG